MEKQYKDGRNDLATGLIFCIFSAAYLFFAGKIVIPGSLANSLLNAASVPRLWGIMMFVLGVIILIRGIGKMNKAKKEGYQPETGNAGEKAKAALADSRAAIEMFVVLFLYILALQPVGFLISTILFLFFEFLILTRRDERNLIVSAVLALVMGVGIYVLFKYGFSMPLPKGIVKFF